MIVKEIRSDSISNITRISTEQDLFNIASLAVTNNSSDIPEKCLMLDSTPISDVMRALASGKEYTLITLPEGIRSNDVTDWDYESNGIKYRHQDIAYLPLYIYSRQAFGEVSDNINESKATAWFLYLNSHELDVIFDIIYQACELAGDNRGVPLAVTESDWLLLYSQKQYYSIQARVIFDTLKKFGLSVPDGEVYINH